MDEAIVCRKSEKRKGSLTMRSTCSLFRESTASRTLLIKMSSSVDNMLYWRRQKKRRW